MKYLFFLLCLFTNFAFAEQLPAGTLFAAKVIDLDSNDVIFEQQPDLLMLPASSQKLVTLYSALRLIDTNESFRTSIYTDGSIKDGKVHGNLYFKFRGDPEFTSEKLEQMVETLKSLKINSITKDIIVDDSEYDEEYFGHGWPSDQTKFCYSAPISAVMVDRNCYKVGVHKAAKSTDFKPEIFPSFARIVNKSKITEVNNLCEFELRAFGDNSYVLDGCYQQKDLPPSLSIAMQDPRKNAVELIGYIVKAKKISFKSLKVGNVPNKVKEISFYNSRPIKALLKDMIKESDNVISETVFKRISAKNTDYAGGWKNSSKLVTDLMVKDLDINRNNISVKDGSGISRKDLISPSTFIKILKSAYSKDIKDDFIQTLPIAGVDGTLRNRFKDTHLEKVLVAKTGTIDNVSTLSGYAFMPSGKKYAFSLMTNNSMSSMDLIKKYEEELLVSLLTN
jgi:D-alanyl-D-alanine carboxypeptidase/D-alanyl-D-alanine-endopeptidase (penicillin-binding protein 4)